VTRNASKFEKIVYGASQRDLISAGSSMKEFFNSHACSIKGDVKEHFSPSTGGG
jgi:hypothetical protein